MTKFNKNSLVLGAIVSMGLSSVLAYTPLTATLDFGAKGTNVTNLQAFFADNATIYPEGLVTGYFGGMTRSAVEKFQATYGIVNSGTAASTGYGRVGPSTLSRINTLINAGGWGGVVTPTGDMYAPFISNVSQNLSSNSATLSWSTNENATGKVFYGTMPLTINEGNENSVGFGVVNGYTATNNNSAQSSQQVTLPNLLSNTTYYYMIVSTDVNGNVSVFGVNNTFRTN
jgi:peptidoglycan hydrolase-like protein with peptidoglycan-binding domain